MLFRFVTVFALTKYIWDHRRSYRFFYTFVGIGLGFFFTPLNVMLAVRVLSADGWLGERGRRFAASGRDTAPAAAAAATRRGAADKAK